MEPHYTVRMYDADGNCCIEEVCFYFRYVKELYTPYVYFECKFLSTSEEIADYNRVEFWIYGKVMHQGIVDSIDIRRSNNRNEVYVKSKGFTSLLCQNQPTPGMMKNVDLNGVITTFSDIPYITCEKSDVENYIYVKDGSTVWDAVCTLGFKQTGLYPYIEGTNNVRIKKRSPSRHCYLDPRTILATGVRHDFTKVISHIHMQDIEGNYDVYSKENKAATDRNIIRHKQIPLDRQFLSNPESALDYKLNFSMRGIICRYIRYVGYNYEDLFDLVTYGEMSMKNVHSVDVIFNGGMPVTQLGFYDDVFYSV